MAIRRNILVLALCSLLLVPAYAADSVKDLQKKQKKLQAEIEQTNKMLKQTKRDESATLNKLQLIGENIKTQKLLINTLDNEISALNSEMADLKHTRDSLQRVLEGYKDDYANMIRQSHYARMQQSPLLFLMSSDSFQQLARRARYLQEFAHYRQFQVQRIEDTQKEIDIQNDLLQTNKSDKEHALSSRKREQENLKRDERKQQNMLDQLKSKEKDLSKQLQQKQKKVQELNKKIDDMIRKQAEQASKTTLTKEQQLIAGGFEANKGRLPWPVEKGMIYVDPLINKMAVAGFVGSSQVLALALPKDAPFSTTLEYSDEGADYRNIHTVSFTSEGLTINEQGGDFYNTAVNSTTVSVGPA